MSTISDTIADRMQAACEKYMQAHPTQQCKGSIGFSSDDWNNAGGADATDEDRAHNLRDQAGRGCAAACGCNDVVTKMKGDANGGELTSAANDINSHLPGPQI